MAEPLQQAFAAYATKEDRHKALEKFVRSMNFEERGHLLHVLSSQNDPLFVFPAEIILQIFNHLPLLDTWTLRRVSQRWRNILSSDNVVRSALSRWETHDDVDSARSRTQNSTASLDSRVRHLKALYTGQPVSEMSINDYRICINEAITWMDAQRMDLQGSRVAYITNHPTEGDAVVLRDLVTGEERTMRGTAREGIADVILTASLVAWITFDGHLYVSHHGKSEIDRLRLPSSRVQATTGHGHVVALSLPAAAISGEGVFSIIIYDARNGALQSFDTPRRCGWPGDPMWQSYSHCLLVDSDQRVIDAFLVITNPPFNPQDTPVDAQVIHLRMSFGGQLIHTTTAKSFSVLVEQQHGMSLLGHALRMSVPRPAGRRGEYRIAAWKRRLPTGEYFRLNFNQLFDRELGTFIAPVIIDAQMPDEDALWKGRSNRPWQTTDWHWHQHVFYMNDTFLVVMEMDWKGGGRIRALCFDPDVQMAQPEQAEQTGIPSETIAR